MRLKSFYGSTLNDAMRAVRETLGEDAIIVATRDDESGGVRVTAAIDEAPDYDLDPDLPDAPDVGDGSEAIELIAKALMKHQIAPAIAERLMASATQFAGDDPVLALGAAFDTHLPFASASSLSARGARVLIGPPGAGKTMAAARIATRATLEKNPVTVISTDTVRGGGMEQLAVFTRLLKLNLIEIEDADSLREAVAMQSKDTLTVVDTPGCNPALADDRDHLTSLVKAAGGLASVLIPATMDAAEAIDMARDYRRVGAMNLVITHLDMTRRLSGMLRLAFETQLPLAEYSASPRVTEPLKPLNPVALARLVLADHDEKASADAAKAALRATS